MQSHYSINVAKDGLHIFATAEHSGIDPEQVRKLLVLFQRKFPASQGYTVDVTHWQIRGEKVPTALLRGTA